MADQQQSYKKARFFKYALQVNPAGYIQYRGQKQRLSESDYNKQLLNTALEAGIEVIDLADHGSVDGVDSIRTLFNQHGIVVFPGFEIASSEKIHFVCLMRANRRKSLSEFWVVCGYWIIRTVFALRG